MSELLLTPASDDWLVKAAAVPILFLIGMFSPRMESRLKPVISALLLSWRSRADTLVFHKDIVVRSRSQHCRRDSVGVERAVVRAAVDTHRRAGDDFADAGICKAPRHSGARGSCPGTRPFSRTDNSNAHALCHAFYVAPDEERQRHVAQTSELGG